MTTRLNAGLLIVLGSLSVAAAGASDPTETAPWRQPGRCGTNCLYAYCKLKGHEISYHELAKAVPTDPIRGSSLAELAAAGARLGLKFDVRKVDARELPDVPTPFIAHFDFLDSGRGGHYFLIVHAEKDGGLIGLDGNQGTQVALSKDYTKKYFTGYVLAPRSRLGLRYLTAALLVAAASAIGLVVYRGRPGAAAVGGARAVENP